VTSTGHLVVDPTLIAMNYSRTWLILDVAASFPFELFFGTVVNTTVLKIFKIPRALRVAKVLKFMEVAVAQRVIMGAFRVSRLLFLLLLVVHWIVCLFNLLLQDPASQFLENAIAKTNLLSAMEVSSGGDGRMLKTHLDVEMAAGSETSQGLVLELYTRYSVLLYYCIVMILGNDTYPTTRSEHVFAATFSLGGAIMQAYIMGEISVLLTSINLKARAWQEKIDKVNEAMAYMAIGKLLL
jgi:hypothetical protein